MPLFSSFVFFIPMLAAQQQPAGVPNFHQLNDGVYRGAQPSEQGFQNLATLGVKTVIDLRESGGRSNVEKQWVEGAGMRYINIPLNGHAAPTLEQVSRLLALLNNQGSGPVFVHCRRGADRTGTIIACYRISHDHWENQKALSEAKADGMSWTELAMKHYVLDFKGEVAGIAGTSLTSAQ
jgi:tyrosine-protein phosphatase SIW14